MTTTAAATDLRCEVHRSGSYTLTCGTSPAAYVLHEYRGGVPNVAIPACKVHASAQARRRYNAHPLTPMTPDVENDIRARLAAAAAAVAADRRRRARESDAKHAARVAEKRSHLALPWTATLLIDQSFYDGSSSVAVRVHPDTPNGSQAWEAFTVLLNAEEDVPATLYTTNVMALTAAATAVLIDVLQTMQGWADELNADL
jgi:hypothetical protein